MVWLGSDTVARSIGRFLFDNRDRNKITLRREYLFTRNEIFAHVGKKMRELERHTSKIDSSEKKKKNANTSSTRANLNKREA